MDKKKLLISAAVAGIFLVSGCATTSGATGDNVKGKCYGVNSCKGKGACGGKDHSCAGQNKCKSKGMEKMTKKQCMKKGGKFKRHS